MNEGKEKEYNYEDNEYSESTLDSEYIEERL